MRLPAAAMKPAPQAAWTGRAKVLVSHRVSDSPPDVAASQDGAAGERGASPEAALNGMHAASDAVAGARQQSGDPQDNSAAERAEHQGSGSGGRALPASAGKQLAPHDSSAPTSRSADVATGRGNTEAGGSGSTDADSSANAAATAADESPTRRLSAQAAELRGGTTSSNMSFATLDSSSAPGR